MSFITLVLGIIVGVVVASIIMTILMLNAPVMKWFTNRYLKVIDDVTKEVCYKNLEEL